jgi:hypothetical protein
VNAAGIWLAGGPGGSGVLERLALGAATPVPVSVDPPPSSILWLTAVGDAVWAETATYRRGGTSVSTRLAAFDATGREIRKRPREQLGDGPLVGSARALWSLGSSHCPTVAVESYPEPLYRVDPATGGAAVATTLRSPVDPCDIGFGSYVAAAGRWVFALAPSHAASQPSTLFRVDG